jgi:tetratricopeptide (TPR) repeat protein
MNGRVALAPSLFFFAFACSTETDAPRPEAAVPASQAAPGAAHVPAAKLLDGVAGTFHRAVGTKSEEAQRFFDQGLTFVYGFNHEEAIRSFQKAAELDPQCAMAYWGMALAAGPNINNPAMDEAASKAAFEAVGMAVHLAPRAMPVNRDLILALSKRYAWPPAKDRSALDRAYADAMHDAWRAHPDDPDVGALFAESMMDLRPWDLFKPDGTPQPGTEEITTTLAAVLALSPDHPGGLHYTIHAWEMSATPEKALPAADRLRARVPGAGHLVHMPSHIDMRIGHYPEAVAANERAIRADLAWVEHAGRENFYSIYRAHNYHMLEWASMFDGQSAKAIAAARELVREMPDALVAQFPDYVEAFLSVPYHALVRFGRWDEILAQPEPPKERPATRTFRHYARATALATLGRLDEAARERAEFDAAAATVPATAVLSMTPVSALAELARALMDGELAYRRGDFDRAFERLRTAVKLDDGLRYDEPHGWMLPARHALGALLLEQGRVEEAESVYREDLKRHAENGWSLHGLAECLRRRGANDEAALVEARFAQAWSRADVKLPGSCFCRTRS